MSGGVLYALSEEGFKAVTMKYEDGGKFEVWSWNNAQVRVPAGTSRDEVKRLLIEAQA